jgi:hypothetical protein
MAFRTCASNAGLAITRPTQRLGSEQKLGLMYRVRSVLIVAQRSLLASLVKDQYLWTN